MHRRTGFIALAIAALLHTGWSAARAQDPVTGAQVRQPTPGRPATPDNPPPGTAATQPTTHPATAQDPLLSPRSMMQAFLLAIGESEKKPERMKDAVACLDLSALQEADPKLAEKQGPLLAKQLDRIIDALLNVYGTSLDEIPEKSDGATVVFPEKGAVQITLARSQDGRWRFSPDTLAAIPAHLESIKEKIHEEEGPGPKIAASTSVPLAFRSARATMRTFLEAMDEGDTDAAALCLDLSDRPDAAQTEIRADLAERLWFVMNRIALVVYQEIPDRPDGEPYAWYIGEHGRIELARQEQSGEQHGYWLFTAATVRSTEPLFKAFQDKPRIEALRGPSFWRNPRLWLLDKIPRRWKGDVWGVQLWQWAGIGMLLVLGYAVYRAAFFILCVATRPFGRAEHIELPAARITSAMRPLGMLVMLGTWWVGLRLLGIPTDIMGSVWPAIKFVMTIVGVWASYRLIDVVGDYIAALAARTPNRLDDVLVPLARKALKIVVVVLGIILILKALNVKQDTLNTLFAGLGIGGFAFAFAAKDTIANFFGSVTVVFDRPFQVGDWVKVGNVEGTVESVGLRSSRVRTFYNSQVTIPNSDLTTTMVDNMGRRRYRRISCKLSVTYSTTPEQLEAFCEGIRELIREHPYTRKDYYVVWVNEFADSAINILLYCFHEVPDWVTELRERHRLFLDIIRLANRLGVEFAFPTQTIHLAKEAEAGDRSTPAGANKTCGSPTKSDDALAWGRNVAAKIAKEALGDSGDIPPPFEFPKA